MICVHCSTPTSELFVSYGPDHLLCTRCEVCGDFADPYVEQELVIVAIDLILVKPRAYRHLLFNRPHVRLPSYEKDAKKGGECVREVKIVTQLTSSPTASGHWWDLTRQLMVILFIDSYVRWYYLCADKSDDKDLSVGSALSHFDSRPLYSYLRVLAATSLQSGALYLSTLFLSIIYFHLLYHTTSRPNSRTKALQQDLDRFQPRLVIASLLLSQITPLFLLSLLLLWQVKPTLTAIPTPTPSALQQQWQWNENSIDWAIRSLVGGLSSGVALGVVLPLQRARLGAVSAMIILVLSWLSQLQVSNWLHIPFHSGVGVLESGFGQEAANMYCA